jgi:putative restriction endonuclease
MKQGQSLWTKNELLLAINLYCKIPFGKMHRGNQTIIDLATLIGRTPSAVSRKLTNFASFDPELKARKISGSSNAGKLDKQVWDEFYQNWDTSLWRSEELLAFERKTSIEALNKISVEDEFEEGREALRSVKVRVNQNIFREIVLASYKNTCCITGINNPRLLVASHIIPWSRDNKNRLNPKNGLCLNYLHDKAFDCGLLTVSATNYIIRVSSQLKNSIDSKSMEDNFMSIDGKQIRLPEKFLPSSDFLQQHNSSFIE